VCYLGIGEYIHKPADVEGAIRDEEEEMTATIDGNEGIPFHFESFYDERKEFGLFDVSDNAVILNSAHPQAISDAILALVTNPGLARMIGENGRNSILPYFSVERQMRQYENLYDAIFELLP
jgi:glycosyltransferase involved in cell wall biosynthesis